MTKQASRAVLALCAHLILSSGAMASGLGLTSNNYTIWRGVASSGDARPDIYLEARSDNRIIMLPGLVLPLSDGAGGASYKILGTSTGFGAVQLDANNSFDTTGMTVAGNGIARGDYNNDGVIDLLILGENEGDASILLLGQSDDSTPHKQAVFLDADAFGTDVTLANVAEMEFLALDADSVQNDFRITWIAGGISEFRNTDPANFTFADTAGGGPGNPGDGGITSWAAIEVGGTAIPDASFTQTVKPTNTGVGTTAGSGGVSGGSATYSIPIVIPPGRRGMAPSLSISYDSRGGNSSLGMGFSLSGLSAITRCPQTQAQDGNTLGVQIADTDRLCLNGSRLVPTSGSYGTHGTVYRKELDDFTRVTQTNGLSHSNSHFKVEYKSGRIAYYGSKTNSRISVTNSAGSNVVKSWLIEREEDRSVNKNSVDYDYEEYGENEVLPRRIFYTGKGSTKGTRKVEFTYADRSDPASSYLAGTLMRQTKKLTKVATYLSSEKLREYTLAYDPSETSRRLLLSSVTECGFIGSGNRCYPATTFDWQHSAPVYVLEQVGIRDENGGFTPKYTTEREINELLPHADVNGDGALDWASWYTDAEGVSRGTHTNEATTCYRSYFFGGGSRRCESGDLNRDGKTDGWRIDGTTKKLEIALTGTSGQGAWVETSVSVGHALSSYVHSLSDFNGDGWPDVLMYDSQAFSGVVNLRLYFHNGSATAPDFLNPFLVHTIQINSGSVFDAALEAGVRLEDVQAVGDMDGNGLPDLMISDTNIPGTPGAFQSNPQPIPKTLLLTKVNSGVVSFDSKPLSQHFTGQYQTGHLAGGRRFYSLVLDINGDGLNDLLADTTPLINKGDGTFEAVSTTGGGLNYAERDHFFSLSASETESIRAPRYAASIKTFDYDSDGRVDILIPGKDESDILVEACMTDTLPKGAPAGGICGNGFYGHVDASANQNDMSQAIQERFNDSIYKWDVIRFIEQSDGSLVVERTPTPLIGSANQSATIDAHGDGLTDLAFVFGCREGANDLNGVNCYDGDSSRGELAGKPLGVYINRNTGSASTGDTVSYRAPDMLVGVENGLGARDEWDYRPLSSRDDRFHSDNKPFYEPDFDYLGQLGAEIQEDHLHFTSSMYVVAEHRASSGNVGEETSTQYRYRGAILNTKGRGFQGFRSVIVEDIDRGTVSRSDFHQIFPLTNRLYETTLRLDADPVAPVSAVPEPIQKTTYTWRFWGDDDTASAEVVTALAADWDVSGDSRWFVGLAESLTEHRDLGDRALMYSTKSTTTFDVYGNPLVQGAEYFEPSNKHLVKKTTTTVYEAANESTWWLNKPSSVVVDTPPIANREGVAVKANTDMARKTTTTFPAWDTDVRLPEETRLVPDFGPTEGIDTHRLYNADGQITKDQSTAKVGEGLFQTRGNTFTYSTDGYFPKTATNVLGHSVTTSTNPRIGQPDWVDDANGVRTNSNYDWFGRLIGTRTDGQPWTYVGYAACASACEHPSAVFTKTIRMAGAPETVEEYDRRGTLRASSVELLDGTLSYRRMDYDNLGRATFESSPYLANQAQFGTRYSSYDALDRLLSKSKDQANGEDLDTLYTYDGFLTSIDVNTPSGEHDLDLSRTHNGLGQLVQTTDALGGITRHGYDGAGNLIMLKDAIGSEIYYRYDDLNRQVFVDDPNSGRTTFYNTGFGEVMTTMDANGVERTVFYDALGRPTSRFVKQAGASSAVAEALWTYDGANGIGALDQELRQGLPTGESFSRSYDYDALGRLTDVTTNIDGESFVSKQHYDTDYGRLKGRAYHNGLTVRYEYATTGYLNKRINASSGYVYQHITDQDEWQEWTSATMGGSTSTHTRAHAPETGQMLSTRADGGPDFQEFVYTYDVFGNLNDQSLGGFWEGESQGNFEEYVYDKLHRLKQNTRTYGDPIDYDYNAVGNLTLKSDYGTSYIYNSGKPNAPNRINLQGGGSITFLYDSNGNRTHENGNQKIWYNSLNKPVEINRNGANLTFTYGPSDNRYKQVADLAGTAMDSTLLYIDALSQRETIGGEVKDRLYIDGVAVITLKSVNTDTIVFNHLDRLGSPVARLDETGDIVEARSFDPFGKPREGDLESNSNSTLDSQHGPEGFTGHEHLDGAQLIHMNGRGYDYQSGQFLSVDPFIVGGSQGMNPYSYVLNNPLSNIDPTGYTPEDEKEEYIEGPTTASCEGGVTCFVDPSVDNGNDEIEEDALDAADPGGNGKKSYAKGGESNGAISTPSSTPSSEEGLSGNYSPDKRFNMEGAGSSVLWLNGTPPPLYSPNGEDSEWAKKHLTDAITGADAALILTSLPGFARWLAFRAGLVSAGGAVTEGAVSLGAARGADNIADAARLNRDLVLDEVVDHAFVKHVLQQGEFAGLGIRTTAQFRRHVDNVLSNPSSIRYYRDGRAAYLQESTRTVVIRNPTGSGQSTAFQPRDWNDYINNVLPARTTPFQ